MARPDFADLRDEALRRMGKLNNQLNSRMEQVMTSAYYTLALTYHHYELHTRFQITLTENEKQIDIPEDAYIVMTVGKDPVPVEGEPPPSLNIKEQLTHDHLYVIFPTAMGGEPNRYARTRNNDGDQDVLIFDKFADRDVPLVILYYRRPVEPVFSGGATSDLDPLWDEFIIQYALQLFWPANFRFDFASVAQATLSEFLARQIQPPLVAPIRDVPERQLSSEAVGGQQ